MSESVENVENVEVEPSSGFWASVISEIIYSPLNVALVVIIAVLIYKIIKGRMEVPHVHQEEPKLPKLRRDFTVQELKKYDGTQPDGRILVAVNGNVYDATKGKRYYGPGGPYAAFGGRDASRCLATFSVTTSNKDEYDDLSDLNSVEMESVREWEIQFKEKYDLVGRLLKPGEEPTNYSEDEDEEAPSDKPSDANAESNDTNVKKRVTIAENEPK